MSKTLGKYRLLREVGRGAMATVYEALDPDLNRRVALKVLREDSNPRTVERLHREAAAVAKLRHPNIVAVHEVGSVDGTHFIVMDYVAGKTLAEARGAPAQAGRIRGGGRRWGPRTTWLRSRCAGSGSGSGRGRTCGRWG